MLSFTFSGTQVLLGVATIVLVLALGLLWLRRQLQTKTTTPNTASMPWSERTKYARYDVFRWRPQLLRVGLVCALAFSFLAFNWTQYDHRPLNIEMSILEDDYMIDNAPPITKHPAPPPPVPPSFEVTDEPIVDTIIFQSMDTNAKAAVIPTQPSAAPTGQGKTTLPPIKTNYENNTIFAIVEDMPYFGDCAAEADRDARKQCSDRALMQFISEHVKYPALARENGIEGTAVVRFVVEKDGSLTDIEILRDPGAGLGDEAARVIGAMATSGLSWTPGMQRKRPVRVQFNLPVRFKLN